MYRKDREGGNNVWVVFDTKTGCDIAWALYWDADTEWTRRTEQGIRLIVEAMNAYKPARGRRAKP
ncbi:MAG TPA: hypothetical protein VG826_33175 [Pirellulales bacterium]|nr:hypothetical protein [Pirellulales bacterium]